MRKVHIDVNKGDIILGADGHRRQAAPLNMDYTLIPLVVSSHTTVAPNASATNLAGTMVLPLIICGVTSQGIPLPLMIRFMGLSAMAEVVAVINRPMSNPENKSI